MVNNRAPLTRRALPASALATRPNQLRFAGGRNLRASDRLFRYFGMDPSLGDDGGDTLLRKHRNNLRYRNATLAFISDHYDLGPLADIGPDCEFVVDLGGQTATAEIRCPYCGGVDKATVPIGYYNDLRAGVSLGPEWRGLSEALIVRLGAWHQSCREEAMAEDSERRIRPLLGKAAPSFVTRSSSKAAGTPPDRRAVSIIPLGFNHVSGSWECPSCAHYSAVTATSCEQCGTAIPPQLAPFTSARRETGSEDLRPSNRQTLTFAREIDDGDESTRDRDR